MPRFRRFAAAGAAALLLLVYVALSSLNDPRGYLGTDTGGKVATLEVMTERGRFDPDLGYWAEEWDPAGRLHPVAFTARTSSGKWMTVTTLPALWIGWQLHRFGGYRAALLVTMAGSVAAALAGRALLHRLGAGGRRAWAGFWLLGLASPIAIYALDFWEHSLGLALAVWAVVVTVDSVQRGFGTAGWRPLLAGALLGAAATMRTEALVYLAVVALVLALALLAQRASAWPTLMVPILVTAGAVGPLVLNELVEREVVGSSIRGPRALGTAAVAGDAPASRVEEAAVTTVGVSGDGRGLTLGAGMVLLMVVGARRRDTGIAVLSLAGAGLLLALRMGSEGLGFVPGLLTAAPVAAAAVAFVQPRGGAERAGGPGRDVTAAVVAIALAAVPVVLATQFRGGAAPQWGARYLLVSGALLSVAGWAALAGRPRPVQGGFVGLAAVVTAFGLVWTSVRTHDVARTVAALDRRPEPVVVSGVYHLAREGGAFYGDKRWLTLSPGAGPPEAASVLTAAGVDAFASVEFASEPPLRYPGFELVNTGGLRLFDGVELRVAGWRRGS